MTLFITEAQAQALITWPMALEAVESAHRDLALGLAQDTPRARTRTPQATLHILQGACPAQGVVGYKAYTSSRSGTRFWVHLFDSGSGEPLAVIEANHLGRMRTGAAAGVATRWLSREEARVLAVIGAGAQAQTQIEAVCAVREISEVRVFARRAEPLQAFCAELSARLKRAVIACATAQEAVAGADVVSTITTSSTPVLQAEWLASGMHLNAAGANMLIRRELDEACVRRADRIVVDTRATAEKECGDLFPLLEKGRTHPGQWSELGEVIAGVRPGRQHAEEITLFESQGLAVQDLALAARLVAAVKAAGV
jgi:ornithine cyclodeaminase